VFARCDIPESNGLIVRTTHGTRRR
jgi:hypothetical protein